MKIPRSELPVVTAAVNTAPVKAVPDPPSGRATAAGASGMRQDKGIRQDNATRQDRDTRQDRGTRQDKDATPVPARADIGNWPDPM
jgi:hypothetical protein